MLALVFLPSRFISNFYLILFTFIGAIMLSSLLSFFNRELRATIGFKGNPVVLSTVRETTVPSAKFSTLKGIKYRPCLLKIFNLIVLF